MADWLGLEPARVTTDFVNWRLRWPFGIFGNTIGVFVNNCENLLEENGYFLTD